MTAFHLPPRSASGVAGLDDVLRGGFIPGRLYLIDGNPGAGKTTLAIQYLLQGVREGERCLYVTLSETADELRTGAASHGWSLDGVDIIELIASEEELDGTQEVTMFHPSEIELTRTVRRVLSAVKELQPARLVFDSLSELRLLAQTSLRYRRQILALKQFFLGRACTVLLLDDRTAEGRDLQLQSIAHGVIALDHDAPPWGAALRQLQVMKFRGSDFVSGKQDVRITRGGLHVFPRLTADEHGSAFPRESVPSGVAALDALLGGGIDRGTSTLLVGPAGSGKSTIAMQYATAAASRGHHAVVFTFEETRSILIDRSRALGMDVAEGVGAGRIAIRQFAAGEILPGEFANLVRAAVEADGAAVVVIDSLNGYLSAMPEERALAVQLHELLSFLNNHGVATFLVASQSGTMGPGMRNPIDASYLADCVVLFRMYEHQGAVRKAISVVKKRSGRHEDTIRRLWMDGQGVHLSEPLHHLRGVLTGVPVESGSGAAEAAAGSSARSG